MQNIAMEELSCLSFIAGEKGCGSPLSTTLIEEEEYLTGTVPMPNQEENSGGIDTSLDLPREDGDVKNTSSLPLIAQHKALEQENGSIPPKSLPIAVCSLVPAQPACSSPTATVDRAVVNNKQPQKVHYPVMIRRAMENARHPQGICSLQAIRRDILELFPETQTKHKASFNRCYSVLMHLNFFHLGKYHCSYQWPHFFLLSFRAFIYEVLP